MENGEAKMTFVEIDSRPVTPTLNIVTNIMARASLNVQYIHERLQWRLSRGTRKEIIIYNRNVGVIVG